MVSVKTSTGTEESHEFQKMHQRSTCIAQKRHVSHPFGRSSTVVPNFFNLLMSPTQHMLLIAQKR